MQNTASTLPQEHLGQREEAAAAGRGGARPGAGQVQVSGHCHGLS